jgi:SH3-like domain-containing protein
VHKSSLTGKRTAIVIGAPRNLLGDSVNGAEVVAHLENGATGQIMNCAKDWCRMKFDGVKGYLRKSEFWGAYPNEVFN